MKRRFPVVLAAPALLVSWFAAPGPSGQLDTGHARAKGDKGAPSTFIKVTVGGGHARYEHHRADSNGRNDKVTLSGSLVKE